MPDYFLPGTRRKKPVDDRDLSFINTRSDTIFMLVMLVALPLIAAVIRFQGLVWQYRSPMKIF